MFGLSLLQSTARLFHRNRNDQPERLVHRLGKKIARGARGLAPVSCGSVGGVDVESGDGIAIGPG